MWIIVILTWSYLETPIGLDTWVQSDEHSDHIRPQAAVLVPVTVEIVSNYQI